MRKASLRELCFFVAIILLAGCGENKTSTVSSTDEAALIQARLDLVEHDIKGAGIMNEDVLRAMREVPRHEFVRLELQPLAYADTPLPSGYGKTISQPFIVAVMTDLLDVQPTDTVLEIGTGLGYQSAILAELAQRVFSIELIEELAEQARQIGRASCRERVSSVV